jgi:hypothetical protein
VSKIQLLCLQEMLQSLFGKQDGESTLPVAIKEWDEQQVDMASKESKRI